MTVNEIYIGKAGELVLCTGDGKTPNCFSGVVLSSDIDKVGVEYDNWDRGYFYPVIIKEACICKCCGKIFPKGYGALDQNFCSEECMSLD